MKRKRGLKKKKYHLRFHLHLPPESLLHLPPESLLLLLESLLLLLESLLLLLDSRRLLQLDPQSLQQSVLILDS